MRGPEISSRAGGFSIPELMMVLGTVTVLIALVAPSLERARRSAQESASAAGARDAIQVIMGVAAEQDSDIIWPGPADRLGRTQNGDPYFRFSASWPRDPVFGSGGPVAMSSPFSDTTFSYWLTCAAISDASFWRATLRTGPEQWNQQNMSNILWPSEKLMIVDASLHSVRLRSGADWDSRNWHIAAYADGSASIDVAPKNIYQGADGVFPGSFHLVDVGRGLHTIDGLRGRDRP